MIDSRIARSKALYTHEAPVSHRAEIAPTYFPLGPSGDELIRAAVAIVRGGALVGEPAVTAANEYLASMFRASRPVERFVKADGQVITLESAKTLGLVS